MLKNLIGKSIEHAVLVVVLAVVLLAAAAITLPRLAVDVFPELNAPTVVVLTEAPGLAAEEVEQYVTLPIESAASGIPGVRRVRTTSTVGLSIAYIEFDWDQDIYRARQLVGERLDAAREELPPDAHAEMTPITSVTGEIMLLAVSSPAGAQGPQDLRSYAEFDLRRQLLAVPGVAQVSVIGGELLEYQVVVDPDKLRLYGIGFSDVAEAAGASHSRLSAGYLADVQNLELPVRQSGGVRNPDDIASTLVRMVDGTPVTIGQVAEVGLGAAPKRGTGAEGGNPAVVLTVQKAPGTNTLELTQAVDDLLDSLQSTTPEGLEINRQVFRQADFIQLAVSNVVKALRDAALIVSVILLLFLLNLRTTLVTLTALPLSLAAGLLALKGLGETINVMTLGGLAIAVGSLVDDAIIDVENVFRRLRENAAKPAGNRLQTQDVIFQASNEIRPAMVFATLIIVLVFVPVLFLDGIEGRFFRPLAIAFVCSLGASLIVALTVTPALCRLLLSRVGDAGHGKGWLVRLLERAYAPLLAGAIRWRILVLGAAALATAASLVLASTFGASFLPEFNEGTFTVGVFAPPGTSLAASDRLASGIERQVLAVDGVRSVTRRTGRAERDEHAEPVSNSEIEVTLLPGFSKRSVRAKVDAILESVPGITTNVGQPIEHRLSHILSGTPAAIAISVYGDDLLKLRSVAQEIEGVLKAMPGTRDVAANREVRIESLGLDYRQDILASYGLTPASAARQVRDAVFGSIVAQVNEGVRRIDLAVRLKPDAIASPEKLSQLVLRGAGGGLVRLDEVADLERELSPNLISRENSMRRAIVSLNVDEGANLGHLVDRVAQQVDPIVQRHGCTVAYGGQFEAQRRASRSILFAGLGTLALMLVLLQLAIGSVPVAMLVLLNLPLALIGGVVAVFCSNAGGPIDNLSALVGGETYQAPVLSIASLVGFITLFGIAVRNGILLVNHYRYLQDEEGCELAEAVQRGSLERLVPILMTALTAALALLPIVLEGDQPGNEILAPLSLVILGGLLTSTFLNLVVVPAGYVLLRKRRA